MTKLVELGWPSKELFSFSNYGTTPVPQPPFKNEMLVNIFNQTMKVQTPLTIGILYFSLVHFINPIVSKRQIRQFKHQNPGEKSISSKRLPPAPIGFTKTVGFKLFVLLHNVVLCVYSVWTFLGMVKTINKTNKLITLNFENNNLNFEANFKNVFQSICDVNNGIFNLDLPFRSLLLFGWLFYVSKFYEVLDTIIILLKGRPSSLLQSYHHAGAMMCMWAGIRYQSPPIWIFVVFNSFIHSLMYFYFSLSCLKIKVPNLFKRLLTSMQITQFVVGGSLAVFHSFVWFTDTTTNSLINCISTPDQALPILINVSYLTPLTGLFAAFYIESYIKRK